MPNERLWRVRESGWRQDSAQTVVYIPLMRYMRVVSSPLLIVVVAALLAPSLPAAAADGPAVPLDTDPDVEIARRHFSEGSRLYAAGAYERALLEFEAARRVRASAALDYNIARCLDRMERIGPAIGAYERYLAGAPDAEDAVAVRARLGTLRARLDERNVARAAPATAAPAQAAVTPPAQAAVTPPAQAAVAAPSAANVARAAPERRGGLRTTGIVLVAVGAAGGGVGAGIFAAGHAQFATANQAATLQERDQTGARGRGFEAAGVALLAVGGAALVAGVICVALPRRGHARAAVFTPSTGAAVAQGESF